MSSGYDELEDLVGVVQETHENCCNRCGDHYIVFQGELSSRLCLNCAREDILDEDE